jgi:hypothetical protein
MSQMKEGRGVHAASLIGRKIEIDFAERSKNSSAGTTKRATER